MLTSSHIFSSKICNCLLYSVKKLGCFWLIHAGIIWRLKIFCSLTAKGKNTSPPFNPVPYRTTTLYSVTPVEKGCVAIHKILMLCGSEFFLGRVQSYACSFCMQNIFRSYPKLLSVKRTCVMIVTLVSFFVAHYPILFSHLRSIHGSGVFVENFVFLLFLVFSCIYVSLNFRLW